MRAFLAAFLAAFVVAGIASFMLERVQSTSDRANTTTGVRLDFARDGVNRPLPR